MANGCGYELFWHLNPRKLETFSEAQKIRLREQSVINDSLAWLYGAYVREAIVSVYGRHKYPDSPMGSSNAEPVPEKMRKGKNEGLTDGQRFYQFMLHHNKQLKEKRNEEP